MKLTALQRKTLEQYRGFHDAPPTVGGLVALAAGRHLLLVLLFGIGVVMVLAVEIPSAAFILVGMVIGAISRDWGTFRRFVRVWPVLSNVLDWARIDGMLADGGGQL